MMPSRVLTIMITDIKGFTERTSSTSRHEIRKLLDEHESLLLPVAGKFGGKVVKGMGDAFLVTFESPTNAVLCGVMMQESLREYNEGRKDEEKIEVRIAINTGEVEVREDDVFGEAVNITARIEGITDASEIFFTEAVYLAMNKAEVPTSEVGLRRFKGIPEAIKVYRVIQDRDLEKYQALIKRLASARPEDFSGLPVAGAPARPARRAWARPVLCAAAAVAVIAAVAIAVPRARGHAAKKRKAAIFGALEKGDYGLALARADGMVERSPEAAESHRLVYAVVEAEARALVEDGRYDDALALVEERAKERPYLRTSPLTKEILVKQAAVLIGRGNYAASSPIYRHLMKTYPKDLQVLMEVVRKLGADFESGPTSLGSHAAYLVSEMTTGPLDDLVGRTLVGSVWRSGPYGDYTAKVRDILASRYPPVFEAARENLRAKGHSARVNAHLMLKGAGRLTAEGELRYHVGNVVLLSSAYQKTGRESVAYLTRASSAADWAERKKAAGIGPIEDAVVLHSWSGYQREVSEVLVRAFLPEIRPKLLEWVEGDDEYLRVNARDMLRAAGIAEKVDEWAFHSKTLANFNVTFIPRHFKEAVEFFRQQAGKERAADALKALRAGREYIRGKIEAFQKRGHQADARRAQENLDTVEEALAAFGEKDR